MRKLKINPSVSPDGGYISRTIAKGSLSSAPITAWTQFYHKPYSTDDWGKARNQARERCRGDALAQDNIVIKGGTA